VTPELRFTTSGTPDVAGIQALAQASCGRRIDGARDATSFPLETSVGAIAWAWGRRDAALLNEWRHRLWYSSDILVAWGWIYPPELVRVAAERTEMSDALLVHAIRGDEDPMLADELLAWFVQEIGDAGGQVELGALDGVMLAALRRHGFAPDPNAPWNLINSRTLERVEEPRLPDGLTLATMRELQDIPRRVAGHRTAWAPGSTLTEAKYTQLMDTWPYRDDLDVVVQAADGTIVACANIWYDEVNRTGQFEPVGTDPAYRARGIGRALMLFGLQQLRDAGATEAVVGCRGDQNYPIPRRLYRSVGFREFERSSVWKRPPTTT
jgi:GNAT superfamily N-acetyltransferase